MSPPAGADGAGGDDRVGAQAAGAVEHAVARFELQGIDEHIASPLLDGENPQFGHIGVVSQTLAVDPQRQVAAFDDEQAVALRGHRDFGQWAAVAGHVGITGLGCELARAFALGIPGPGDGGYGDGERLCGGRGLGHGGFGALRWTELKSVYQVK